MLFVSAGRWRLRHCAAHKPLCFAPYDPIVHDSDPHAIVALGVRRQRLTDSALHYTRCAALAHLKRACLAASSRKPLHARELPLSAREHERRRTIPLCRWTERASELYNSQTIRASIYIYVGTISLQYVTQAGNASFRQGQRQCAGCCVVRYCAVLYLWYVCLLHGPPMVGLP